MNKKEQIIQILKIVDKYHYCLDSDIERYADEILALPLEVLSDDEIRYRSVRDEIIKRNG